MLHLVLCDLMKILRFRDDLRDVMHIAVVFVQRELKAKKEEHDRWKNVPDWKKRLILDKEKKKQQEMVK